MTPHCQTQGFPNPLSLHWRLVPEHFGFDAAIFDFDGTVADSLGVWRRVDRLFLEERGLPYTPEYAEMLSRLGFEAGAQFIKDTYGLADTIEDICGEWNRLGRELYRTDVKLYDGAVAYIERLHAAGIPVGLATTNAPEVVDVLQTRYPLDQLFPLRVHGCEVAHPTKDYPDIYAECARRLDVLPNRCVLFEDLPAGLVCAKQLGMTCIGVQNKNPQQNLAALQTAADYIVTDWAEMLDIPDRE